MSSVKLLVSKPPRPLEEITEAILKKPEVYPGMSNPTNKSYVASYRFVRTNGSVGEYAIPVKIETEETDEEKIYNYCYDYLREHYFEETQLILDVVASRWPAIHGGFIIQPVVLH